MCLSSVRWPAWLLLVAVLGLAVLPGAVRADNLDVPLAGHGWRIHRDLRDESVKNVGVLPFRVKKGTRPESFIAGPINTSMVTRVENALIMNEPRKEENVIGIIRNAGATASRAKVGDWYTNPAERKKLFEHNYDLAWGTRKVKPDAFITGLISNTGNREKTEVIIQAFYKKEPEKLVELARFTVDSDRSLLSDLGYNFALSRAALVKARSSEERNKAAASLVRRRDEGQAIQPEQGETATPENVGGLSISVTYDGVEQVIKPISDGIKGTEYFVPPIKEGTKLQIALTYNGKREDKIGAILKVNGVSTWQEQVGDSVNMQKWLYSKEKHLGKPDAFDGYYMDVDGKNLKPWRILSAEQSKTLVSQMGQRVGYIDLEVFASGGDIGDERMKISTRGMVRDRGAAKPATMKDAQTQILAANFVKMRKVVAKSEDGGLIAPSDEAIEAGKIEQGSLPNATLLGSLHIKYYDPATTPLQISKP